MKLSNRKVIYKNNKILKMGYKKMGLYGYVGRIAYIDLTNKEVEVRSIEDYDYRKYLGGRGLSLKILFEEIKPKIDPLSSENVLVFLTGPLTGVKVPGSSRYGVFSKSPLTGIWGEGNAGGFFGVKMKKSGFDGLVIKGKSIKPVFLYLNSGKIEFHDAQELWGKNTTQTESQLKKIYGDGGSVSCIGTAGEKLLKIASIINDSFEVVGRCGLGAVAGSKNLKAIVAKGSGEILEKNPHYVSELYKEFWEKLKNNNSLVSLIREFGTAGSPSFLNSLGMLPTKNFQTTFFEGAENLDLTKEYEFKSKSCWGCPVACKKIVKINGKWLKMAEYETQGSFGSNLLNSDIVTVIKASNICNDFGVDTISAGVIIGFAIECFENGIISKSDLDGIELKWGDSNSILELLHKIVRGDGIGRLLSNGVKAAAEKIGRGTEKYAMHIKGLEIPFHTPRARKGLALNYATSVRGACHTQCEPDPVFEIKNSIPELGIVKAMKSNSAKGKPKAIKETQDWAALRESMIMCWFTTPPQTISPSDIVNLFQAALGWDIDITELSKIGERANNLARVWNLRESISREDDAIPKRFYKKIPNGPEKGTNVSPEEFKNMLEEYYHLRGWDNLGIPTKEKLQELGLDFVIDDLSMKKYYK